MRPRFGTWIEPRLSKSDATIGDEITARYVSSRPILAIASARSGRTLRGTFVVNPEGLIKVAEVNDLGIGRDARELLRKVQAAQYVASHPGEVCPARWTPGAKTLAPSLDLVGKI